MEHWENVTLFADACAAQPAELTPAATAIPGGRAVAGAGSAAEPCDHQLHRVFRRGIRQDRAGVRARFSYPQIDPRTQERRGYCVRLRLRFPIMRTSFECWSGAAR